MLRYSNQTVLNTNKIAILLNTQNASDVDRFNEALSPLLNNVTAEASGGGSLRKFATGNTRGPGVTSIYALAQCTPDLTPQQCKQCLESVISVFTNAYREKIGGRSLVPTCNFRYELSMFHTGYKYQTPAAENTETESMDIGTAESLQYSFSVVKAATNDFADDSKLGQGGFGAVYKAWKTWRNGTPVDMIDTTLKTGSGSLRDTIRCIHIGLLCVQENPVDRPTMASVVLMLNSFSLTLPLPSGPAFFMHSGTDPEMPLFSDYTSSTSSSGPGKYKLSKSKSRSSQVSVNDLSISEVVPR
ncbi:hypothetical protein CTI12_AA208380 [Artemisia annua]|uniref:Gnk2-homologous domain-containing protein n=1 Tax=Artemisia annua TaxID=35608 RepID=A0A2U1P030_ARTAN|nr:hypothetical protein CTI12_AA208380 [Artemisia annua]